MTMRTPLAGATALALLLATPAGAHVVLDKGEAPAAAYVRLAFQVGHGCPGQAATTAIRVLIPEGVTVARPMPHPGWTLSRPGAAPQAAGHHGHAAASGHDHAPSPAGEIAWTGGRLEDGLYDEFVLQIRTPETQGALAFPVVQECEGGKVSRWIEPPAPDGARVANPAPVLRVVAR